VSTRSRPSRVQAALAFAEQGWPVLPLAPRGKAPLAALAPHGVAHATCDPEAVSDWWRRAPDANIAIACHRLFAVDVDPRNGGDRKLAALLDARGPFPTTPTQRTGGGGTHYLFRLPAVPLLGKLVHGVDLIHGPRRYIVAAPSVLKGCRDYEWLTPPSKRLAEVPGWLLGLAMRAEPRSTRPGTLPTVARSRLVARAAAYARKIPPAISGQGGHAHTFMTACRLVRGFLLDAEEAYAVMCDWNRSCKPPWSERDLRRRIEQAVEHGRLPFGALLETETM
jgi:hypothetical protein